MPQRQQMTELKTDPELLERIMEAARKHKMSPAERRAQRISFIHGTTGHDKALISKILDGQ